VATAAIALALTGAHGGPILDLHAPRFHAALCQPLLPADREGPPGGWIRRDRDPDYHDFLYYAFVVACTAQTAM